MLTYELEKIQGIDVPYYRSTYRLITREDGKIIAIHEFPDTMESVHFYLGAYVAPKGQETEAMADSRI